MSRDNSEFGSTARALALSVEDPMSPSYSSTTPSWHRRTFSYGRRQPSNSTSQRYKDRIRNNAEKLQRQYMVIYSRLSPIQRALLVLVGLLVLVSTVLFLVFNERILAWLEPAAKKWREVRGGWVLLWLATFVVGFPPLIGYSSCITIAGFVYGFPNGWFIVASATVIGSTASFVVSRTILSGYTKRLIENDKRFAAFSLTLKHDGLKILCMLRLCPLPYSISNGAISTFPTVSALNFAIATAIASPKLLIHVFVGSRLAKIGGGEMDAKTRAVNWLSIIFGLVIGIATGLIIYRKTKARAAELEAEEYGNTWNTPRSHLAREYSDEPIETQAKRTLRGEDDISLRGNDDFRDESDEDEDEDEDDVFNLGDDAT